VATLNQNKIREEILNLIRNSDIFSTTLRGVTTDTDTFTATAAQTNFTLLNEGVKNVRSLKINDVLQTLYVDYDINIYLNDKSESTLVTLTTGATLDDDVEVEYDYSASGDKVYPDFPDEHLNIESFPRIYFDILSEAPQTISANDGRYKLSLLFEFGVVALNKNVIGYEQALYDLIMLNRKSLCWLNLIRPTGRTAKESYKKVGGNWLFTKMFTMTAPTEFES
jgi:hypothetical protein